MPYIKSRIKDLSPEKIEEFFNKHLPYRMGILLTYVNIEKDSKSIFRKDIGVRNCTFEACLVMCRVLMNFLGINIDIYDDKPPKLKSQGWFSHNNIISYEVKVEDLGGKFVEIDNDNDLIEEQRDLLARVYLMANNASAHLRYHQPFKDEPIKLVEAAEIILGLIKTKLEDIVKRQVLIT
jgi:hypothetical protein